MGKARQQKTTLLTKEEAIASRRWILLDAEGKTLGRFAAEAAQILRGKHKVDFTSHVDCGDGVIIVNAEKIVVTGAKEAQKIYRHYTGSMGGLREIPYRVMMARRPTEILRRAIEGMVPNTRLGKQQVKKLRIFAGNQHDHKAQQPIAVEA